MSSRTLLCAVLALVVIAASAEELLRFDGHKLISTTPENETQLQALFYLRRNLTVSISLDWWTDPTIVSRPVFIRISPENTPFVEAYFARFDITFAVIIEDIQPLIDQQRTRSSSNGAFNFSEYHTLDEINTWVQTLPRQYPDLVQVIQVATSYENRPIYAVKITNGTSASPKPGFWFDGCIHSREWIATATVLYILNELLQQFDHNNQITALINSMEIFVLPVFNVDGYDYTWTKDRMWRKTRSKGHGVCVGVDPNRNWDFHWADGGASGNPCDDAYEGPKAFSEVEVRTVAGYIKNNSNINGYINFHSFSQLWMSPWGYTADKPKDYTTQEDLSSKAVAALAAVHGTKYEYGPIYTTIYPASGNSADWTYGVSNVIYSYGVELRDTGEYGFLLPASEIVPSGEETLAAIIVALQYVLDHPRV